MENNLAENIRSHRKSLGFTQEQLAERLGITLATVSKWERGGSEPELSYIMDLAELFHVSVDALIGFSMRGTDADTEAERIEALDGREPVWKIAGEYENALKKFPNHFRIVCGAALLYKQIGVVYRKEEELHRALDLFRHAIDLFSQNRNPDVHEADIRNEIAQCYSALKDYKRAIEEYRKNNETGSCNAQIGLLYTQYEKKPEEGIVYTDKAFLHDIGDMMTTLSGYLSYYAVTGRYERGIRAAEWSVRFLESLKADPGKPAFVDKIIPLFCLDLAVSQDNLGMTEASEESLRTAVRKAAEFDRSPVFTLGNMVLLNNEETLNVYDDTGPTAIAGLKSSLEQSGECVSEAFREKFEREIRAVVPPEPPEGGTD